MGRCSTTHGSRTLPEYVFLKSNANYLEKLARASIAFEMPLRKKTGYENGSCG